MAPDTTPAEGGPVYQPVFPSAHPGIRMEAPVDGLSIAGMILGITGFVLGWLWLVVPVLAVILSAVSLHRINRSGGYRSGKGFAVAGLVCGIVSAVIYGLIFLLALAATA